MEYIRSRDIFLLIRDTLKLYDPRPMQHGSRVAYIVAKMMQCKGGYEGYELADAVMLITLHDIGAYTTDDLDHPISFENKNFMQHSAMGYLFFNSMSPFGTDSKVILYHHSEYSQMKQLNFPHKELAAYLYIAEKYELYFNMLKEQFDYHMMDNHAGTKYSPEGLALFDQAVREENMLEKLKSGEYIDELKEINQYMIFSNEDKENYLKMLVKCIGFRSVSASRDTIASITVCQEIGDKMVLGQEEREILYYSAMLHDLGMIAIPKEIIEAPRRLTPEETTLLRTHVMLVENIMKARVKDEIFDVISAHHERGDGTGYPCKLKFGQMNLLQQILQVADVFTALTGEREYRETKTKKEVLQILNEEADKGRLNREVIGVVILYYDEIMDSVSRETQIAARQRQTMKKQYELMMGLIGK